MTTLSDVYAERIADKQKYSGPGYTVYYDGDFDLSLFQSRLKFCSFKDCIFYVDFLAEEPFIQFWSGEISNGFVNINTIIHGVVKNCVIVFDHAIDAIFNQSIIVSGQVHYAHINTCFSVAAILYGGRNRALHMIGGVHTRGWAKGLRTTNGISYYTPSSQNERS